MASEREAVDAVRNGRRVIGYVAGGAVGALGAASWLFVSNILVLNYFLDQMRGRLRQEAPPTFLEHINDYSPLGERFWHAVGGDVPQRALAGLCLGAVVGVFTGCFDPLVRERGATKFCALAWGVAFALPLLVSMLKGDGTPVEAAMKAAAYVSAGLILGGAMGLSANLWERWLASLGSRFTAAADRSLDPPALPPSTPPSNNPP